jgi:hypothetical protein
MLHAGLDFGRKKLDVCLLSDQEEHLDQLAVPPDVDSLRTLARRLKEVHAEPIPAVIESITGARLVHDTLEQQGWAVEIADAQKVKGLAPRLTIAVVVGVASAARSPPKQQPHGPNPPTPYHAELRDQRLRTRSGHGP